MINVQESLTKLYLRGLNIRGIHIRIAFAFKQTITTFLVPF